MTTPADGATVNGVVALSADASDAEGIQQVEFFVRGSSVGVDSAGGDGWGLAWDSSTSTDGAAAVRATVTDTAGQTASDQVGVTIDNLGPTVSLTAPADGATVSGTVNVTATATDAVGLARVEFTVDGTSIGVDTTGGNGWSVQWDTTTHPGGAASVSATAIDTAGRTASDAASVTVDNSPPGTVVMVVANPSSLIAGEVAVRNRLTNDGFSVSVIDDNLVTAADANGTAFVFVSSTADANTLRARLRDVPQPVWMAKPYLLDDMLMTGPAADVDYGNVVSASVAITNAAHPLAAGLSGTVTVTTANHTKSFGVPGPAADVVATANGRATTFVYQAGDPLVGGTTAAGCRLTSSAFQNGPASFTAAGWTLFDAAADYAASNCG